MMPLSGLSPGKPARELRGATPACLRRAVCRLVGTVWLLATLGACENAGRDVPAIDAGPRCETLGAGDGGPSAADGATAVPSTIDGLPVVAVEVAADDWERLHADAYAPTEIPCGVTLLGQHFADARLELHGGLARQFEKKSYRVKLPEFDGEPPTLALFGAAAEPHRRFVLNAAWIDRTFARNRLTMQLRRQTGGFGPRVEPAALCINGHFHGLYTLVERIDQVYLQKQGFDPGGNLYKAENNYANFWLWPDEPLKGYLKKLNENEPADDLVALLTAVTSTPRRYADYEAAIAPRLSLDDHRRFMMVHIFADDQDSFMKNYYLYRDIDAAPGAPDAAFRVISWDADATFGNYWDGTAMAPDGERLTGPDALSPRLYGIAEYRRAYLEGFAAELSAGALQPEPIVAELEAWRRRVTAAARRDAERWNRPADFDAELDRLTAAVRRRHEVMSAVVARELAALGGRSAGP